MKEIKINNINIKKKNTSFIIPRKLTINKTLFIKKEIMQWVKQKYNVLYFNKEGCFNCFFDDENKKEKYIHLKNITVFYYCSINKNINFCNKFIKTINELKINILVLDDFYSMFPPIPNCKIYNDYVHISDVVMDLKSLDLLNVVLSSDIDTNNNLTSLCDYVFDLNRVFDKQDKLFLNKYYDIIEVINYKNPNIKNNHSSFYGLNSDGGYFDLEENEIIKLKKVFNK